MEYYKLLVDKVGAFLKTRGFVKKGNGFYTRKENNWGLLHFQKSLKSSGNAVLFTINLGTSSTKIRDFLGKDVGESKPEIDDCHWKIRIGFILPQKEDTWWTIEAGVSVEQIAAEIVGVLSTLALPEIMKHISDESLEQHWLTGASVGLTSLQKFIYLTTLLRLNNKPILSEIVAEFKDFAKINSFEYRAKSHLQKLGLSYE